MTVLDDMLENAKQEAFKKIAEATAVIVMIVVILALVVAFFLWMEAKSNKPLNRSVWLKFLKVIA